MDATLCETVNYITVISLVSVDQFKQFFTIPDRNDQWLSFFFVTNYVILYVLSVCLSVVSHNPTYSVIDLDGSGWFPEKMLMVG